MELKVQQLKLVGVANAKAVIVKIAENVPLAKTNHDLAVVEPKNKLAFIEFVLGRILLEKGLLHKHPIWQIHQRVRYWCFFSLLVFFFFLKYFRSTNQGFIILYQIRILILKSIFSGVPSGTIVSPAAVRRQQAGPEVSTTPKAETPSKGVKRGRGRGRKSISVVSPAVDVSLFHFFYI